MRRLADDLGIDRALLQDQALDRARLVARKHITAMGAETLAHCIIDGINHDDRLFRGADDAIVEGLRHQDRGNSALDIGKFIDDGRRIAGTHADCRLA
ncbi:hypothetical protein D3C73_1323680 [compost metagenome]